MPGRRGTESLPARGPRTRSQKAFSDTPMKLEARQRYSPPSRSDTLARRRRASASTLSLIQDCGDKRPGSGVLAEARPGTGWLRRNGPRSRSRPHREGSPRPRGSTAGSGRPPRSEWGCAGLEGCLEEACGHLTAGDCGSAGRAFPASAVPGTEHGPGRHPGEALWGRCSDRPPLGSPGGACGDTPDSSRADQGAETPSDGASQPLPEPLLPPRRPVSSLKQMFLFGLQVSQPSQLGWPPPRSHGNQAEAVLPLG